RRPRFSRGGGTASSGRHGRAPVFSFLSSYPGWTLLARDSLPAPLAPEAPCSYFLATPRSTLRRKSPMYRTTLPLAFSCFLLLGALGGCHQQPPQAGPPQEPVVPVARPEQREVTDYV